MGRSRYDFHRISHTLGTSDDERIIHLYGNHGCNQRNPLATAVNRFGTFATNATLGTDPANNLFAQDWNVLGGGGVIVLPIGGEWFIVNSCDCRSSADRMPQRCGCRMRRCPARTERSVRRVI
jgi:hypothetical protein